MNFGKSIETCMEKYACFEGRASRSEFWWFYLFTVLISWGAHIVGFLSFGALGILFPILTNLVLIVPSLSVSARRLHDTGRSGYWLFLTLTLVGVIPLIIWLAQRSVAGSNAYGELTVESAVTGFAPDRAVERT